MSAQSAREARPAQEAIARVCDGVFFTLPEVLPRGRHKLAREQVIAAQRERLLVATTELLAARGHRGFGAPQIASRAGVSLAAFYGCFSDKDACVFAGYDRFIDVLLRHLMAVKLDGLEQEELVPALTVAYLETLQSDLVVARAYQVEIDALGSTARERRRDSLKLFAAYVRDVVTRESVRGGSGVELPSSAYLGVVYAVRQLASDALDESPQPDLIGLGGDLRIWLGDVFRRR